ncbi:hypothetical protein NDU88_006398 [Pleurodeles waltl]|uniref:Uncharacterized protein n=1 Tax=Pleurodeles waltl TaxID=8319 RepID=A0AAV7LQL4_PLEWA|nr:hypothetical protein NDU88_006398 [Pleurodeles waltl]
MGRTKQERPTMGAPGTQGCGVTGELMRSLPEPLEVTLVEHSQRVDEILNAVLDIKTTLEPKIDALRIDMGHMREDHKKLKEQVEATEFTMASLRPMVSDATSHIRRCKALCVRTCCHTLRMISVRWSSFSLPGKYSEDIVKKISQSSIDIHKFMYVEEDSRDKAKTSLAESPGGAGRQTKRPCPHRHGYDYHEEKPAYPGRMEISDGLVR